MSYVIYVTIYHIHQLTNFDAASRRYMANVPAPSHFLPGICAESSASNQFFSQTTDVQRGSPGEEFSAAKTSTTETLDGWLVTSCNPKKIASTLIEI